MNAIGIFEMEFGPEIKVDGVRPGWLEDDDHIHKPKNFNGHEYEVETAAGTGWSVVKSIRLPANHPHYATPTPDERAVAPELVERMRQLVEDAASDEPGGRSALRTEARAILAALEPVDENVKAANQIIEEWVDGGMMTKDMVLAAIKRGRQLEKEGK